MRQVVLDTETTGLEPADHRVIEIGAVELIDRRPTGRTLHYYLNPQRDIDDAALEIHGLTRAFLADKPLFGSVVQELLDFVGGAELIIHNAAFDIDFLNAELARLPAKQIKATQKAEQIKVEQTRAEQTKIAPTKIETVAFSVIDSLQLARQKHPGQKNSLDALCRRYAVDDSHREYHGALLDAQLLANVYLAMTGGQTSLLLAGTNEERQAGMLNLDFRRLSETRGALAVILPTIEEEAAHQQTLDRLQRTAGKAQWRLLPAFFAVTPL